MRRNNDKMLLESLIRKYGTNGVKNVINKINEDTDEDVILDRLSGKDPEPEMTMGLTNESMQHFKDDFYRALNDVAQKWEFRYICPSDDDWFNTLEWFLKEFRNRNF